MPSSSGSSVPSPISSPAFFPMESPPYPPEGDAMLSLSSPIPSPDHSSIDVDDDDDHRRHHRTDLSDGDGGNRRSSDDNERVAGHGGGSSSANADNSDQHKKRQIPEYESVDMGGIDLDDVTRELVLGYLVECGFKDTALSFLQAQESLLQNLKTAALPKTDSEDDMDDENDDIATIEKEKQRVRMFFKMDERKEILDHLAQGRISEAFQIAKDHFKTSLEKRPDVEFGLHSLMFIEMVRQGQNRDALQYAQQNLAPLVRNSHMDSHIQDAETAGDRDGAESSMFWDNTSQDKMFDKFMAEMKDMLTLLCHRNPEKSPVAHLLSAEYRDTVVHAINSAILEDQKLPPIAPLKKLLFQLVQVRNRLHRIDRNFRGTKWSLTEELS